MIEEGKKAPLFILPSSAGGHWMVVLAFLVGTLARVAYAWATPPAVRAHDFPAHLGYVVYVERHWAIPDWRGEPGFDHPPAYHEFFQPPLYYFLAGGLLRLAGEGHSVAALLGLLQGLSTLLSVLALAAGLEIGRRIFPGDENLESRVVYSWLLALFPGPIIDVAGRITNDALTLVVALTLVAALLAFQGRPGGRRGVWLGVVLGLGLLTKASFLVLGACASTVLLTCSAGSLRRRAGWIALLWALAVAISGWFYVLRFQGQGQTRLVANVDFPEVRAFNEGSMRVPNSVDALLTLDPRELLRHPFNDPLHDEARRQYFSEFLFRSALFGEHDFGTALWPLARVEIALTLLAVPMALVGLVISARRRSPADVVMLALALFSLAGLLAHRIQLPFASNQDFRFVNWTSSAICCWWATAAASRYWRRAALLLLGCLLVSWLLFFARIAA